MNDRTTDCERFVVGDATQLSKRPLVSVVMITFNHERFIEQAVNSALMQQTTFDYEIIIGEDCSSDRTREILLRLHDAHRDKIKLVIQSKNVGLVRNFVSAFNFARGDFVAFLEGDDYWIHPGKLERQVDLMRANPECMLCFHAFQVIIEDRPNVAPHVIKPLPNVPNKADGFSSMQFGTFLYRRCGLLPRWFGDLRASAEWPLITWVLMQGGRVCSIADQPMSVYRKHENGVSTMSPRVRRGLDKMHDYQVVTQNMSPQQRKKLFHTPLYGIHLYLCRAYISEGKAGKARYHLLRYIYHRRPHSVKELSKAFKLVLQCFVRMSYQGLKRSDE